MEHAPQTLEERLNEVSEWFFERITKLLEQSPYMELVDGVDTAGLIRALFTHASLAAVAMRLKQSGRKDQINAVARTMANDLCTRLNEMIVGLERTHAEMN